MPTLEQQRARLAFEHVTNVSGLNDAARKKYATMIHALPALLRSAGLNKALVFINSRNDDHQRLVLDHLSSQLNRVDPNISNAKTLLERTLRADLGKYLWLTRESLACSGWYRRFVQGILKIEAGEDVENR